MLFMVRSFLLLIHFLPVEDYELPKSTSHILSVLLTLERVKILFSYFNCLADDVMCKIPDLTQQVEIGYELYFDLKNMKMQYQKYQKMQFCIQSYIDIWEIILYLQANPY